MRKRTFISIFIIIISLWLGMQFYVQPEREAIIIKKIAEILRIPVIVLPDLPSFLDGSLSDGLWMLAMGCTMMVLWGFSLSHRFIIHYGIAMLLGISFELGQMIKIFPGTFDPCDCLAILIGGLFPFILLTKKLHHEF